MVSRQDSAHVRSRTVEARASGSALPLNSAVHEGIFPSVLFLKCFSPLGLQAHFWSLTAFRRLLLQCGPLHCGLRARGPHGSQVNLPWNKTALVEKINGSVD